MAQSVEHVIGNDEVTSSNLVSSSRKERLERVVLFLLLMYLLYPIDKGTFIRYN